MPFTQTKLPCPFPDCDSSDAYAMDEDGNGRCFSCNRPTWADESMHPQDVLTSDDSLNNEDVSPVSTRGDNMSIEHIKMYKSSPMPERGITQDITDKYGVKTEFNEITGEPEKYFFPYYKKGAIVGYKVRKVAAKEFYTVGDISGACLFGSQVVGENGKLIIITEGEMDTLAAYAMLKEAGKNYKVVSLPSGANVRGIKDNLEFLEGFETVMLNFDSDEKGNDCTERTVSLLSVGKVKVMTLPVKDANDLLLSSHRNTEYFRAVQQAKTYRPDGIIQLGDTWDLMFATDSNDSIPYPWDGLNDKLYGMRKREIITITSGSGMGKSAVTRELTHHLLKQTNDNIGVLALEESIQRTAWGIVSVEANLPLSIREERLGVSEDSIREAFDATIGTGRVFTLDHFGSTSEDTLLSRVRYMTKSLDCGWVILDHLSIVVSAMEDGGDERRTIDSIMTRLRQLVEETNMGLILVSHLRRASGDRGHEQGVEVSLSHLRGSQSIAQLSDCVIALERDQQADDDRLANLTRVRVLKNRYAGLTGLATSLYYDRDTGRLKEIDNVQQFLNPEGEF